MPISNYGDLKAELSEYMVHQRWIARYDNVTRAFENAANRRLRVRQMETVAPLTTNASGSVNLPADYLLWRTVLWTGRAPAVELDYVHPAYATTTYVGTRGANPSIFKIEGNELQIFPIGTYDIQFHYYAKIPTLVGGDGNTNWLLDAYSDAYLFGVLTELAALSRNAEMAQLYKARRDEVMAEIIQLSALTTGATSPQVRTAEYY